MMKMRTAHSEGVIGGYASLLFKHTGSVFQITVEHGPDRNTGTTATSFAVVAFGEGNEHLPLRLLNAKNAH